MNGHGAEQWARWHQQDLLDEASRERLAAVARGSTDDRVPDGAGSHWWRLTRSALIALGAALADGHFESASHRA